MSSVYVRYGEDMPIFIKGFVCEDEDGDYNVYINPKFPHDIQRKTLRHELDHIRRGDFRSKKSITEIEGM